ncbi:unnamed protein product [Adineta steineri]|uniref:YrhK domain-containing protein n=1 Tax=Adineta steineri TaxID=433720 RepID=A0A814QM29_9BILA|nr:unnamed protein product [Adineta steineri]CAF1122466.1 unnamed protein product [Adineta steineri]
MHININWKLHTNILLNIVGSILFIIGSIFFHPHFSVTNSLYKTGVLTFVFGSVLFYFSSLQQLFMCFQNLEPSKAGVVNDSKPLDLDLAISFCRHTLGCCSGILFIVGSAAFYPTYGHCGVLVGNWLFRCGATLSVLSYVWFLIREQMKSSKFSLVKLVVFIALLGSIGFLIGGAFFLAGPDYASHGSFAWVAGSVVFLLSSVMLYKL